jgi:DNA-directed RNA polymerase subunit RPC12/RpoP
MDETVSLRCKFCGAPFEVDSLTSDSSYITCTSCGTSQTRIDAKNYLEQMMGQVKSWISKAIPTGIAGIQSDNIDAVARHNIFSNSVRPAIETELTEYRFGFLSLLSNQLIMMPHRTNTSFRSAHQSSGAFEFNAKAKSVAPLAVDSESMELMRNADKMSMAYAMMINNMKLLSEDKPGRYDLMAANFSEAADSLAGLQRYDVVRQRFEALSEVSKGISFLEQGNAIESRVHIQSGLTMLEAVKQSTMTNMEFGSTYLAVEQESAVTKALLGIVETALHDQSINPLEILDVLKKVMDVAAVQYRSSGPEWGGAFKNVNRYIEIFNNISLIFASRAGKGGVPIAGGAGSVLLPFWHVDLRYSFVTGLLSKKSVEVQELLLVPATFVTNPDSMVNPKTSVTDIFASRPGGIMDILKGSEKSISKSEEIGSVVGSVSDNSVGTRKAVAPVSTKNEAEALVLRYLKQCTADDSKLKLIRPTVDRLIYVPCEITDSGVSMPTLGKMSPKAVGRLDLIKTLYI